MGPPAGLLAHRRDGAARRAGLPLAGRRARGWWSTTSTRRRARRLRRDLPGPAVDASGATASCCPVSDFAGRVDLGEGATPLRAAAALRSARGSSSGSRTSRGNPTGSFKARGLSLAVNRARELGAPGVQLASAGNAALALTAYAAAAGLPARVALPEDTPRTIFERCREYGAEVLSGAGHAGRGGEAAGAGQGALLDALDPARALPGRGEEDDGPGARRAARLGAAGLDRLPPGRRHRHRRHAQGVRRAASGWG